MTAPRPETVAAMRSIDAMRAVAGGGYLLPIDAAVVADRLVAEAVNTEQVRIAGQLRDLAVSLGYSASGHAEEIANRLDPEGGR